MRLGLALGTAVLILAGGLVVAHAQSANSGITASVVLQTGSDNPWEQQLLMERLGDTLRCQILTCIMAGAFLLTFTAFLGRRFDWQNMPPEITCRRCLKVHGWAGAMALGADMIALGSIFYLATLPFASALKAEAYRPDAVATTTLLGVAFLVALAGLGFLTRLFAKGRKDPLVSLFAGARLAALIAAVALLLRGIHSESVSVSVDSILGQRLGERLLSAIGSAAIRDTALVLITSFAASEILRWIVPVSLGSKPLMLMRTPKAPKAVTA